MKNLLGMTVKEAREYLKTLSVDELKQYREELHNIATEARAKLVYLEALKPKDE